MESARVLLIEDDPTVLSELAELLGKEKFDVITAADGEVGLKLFNEQHPDLVITDLRVPGKNGLEVMAQIRKKRPEVPVILVTGFGETEIALKAIRLGALDYLKKPVDLDTLLIALSRARERIDRNKLSRNFPTILLADDETLIRNSLADVLKQEGWHTVEAENGLHAVEIFQEQKVDIALLDIKMPKMDGISALHKMREMSDDFEAIIITGYGDETAAIQALRDGAMNFIKKPIDLEELLVFIDKAIQKITLQRAYKHRMRELELSRQVIAQISDQTEITIRTSVLPQKGFAPLSNPLLDFITDGIAVVDGEMNVVFANRALEQALQQKPRAIDENCCQQIAQLTNSDVELSEVRSAMEQLMKRPVGAVWDGNAPDKNRLIMTHINLTIQSQVEEYVLLAVRSIN